MNRLSKETSPYLLQHAHNPVNWYPWGEEALERAQKEDKPILVSIGYSACHWCHVMERESFEDADTARIMNEFFINIKIDREERPDLDHLYMDAVQAMTGGGGWPLNVFLTPDAKPFYGGTYYPPIAVHNRPSWKDVLFGISNAFKDKRKEIEEQAKTLTDHLIKANSFGFSPSLELVPQTERFTIQHVHLAFQQVMGQADQHWGGFGRAPKFPQTFTISFLLRYYHFTGNEEALRQALLSLDKMIMGGIYDHLGGGFARYSTDTEWLAPHFEKMLYDNALLVSVLCDAFQITRNARYEQVIRETLAFTQREMMSTDGAFYAALDADSEGVEGKFYTWSKKEVYDALFQELGEDAATVFCSVYDISEDGNWEHTNIPRLLNWPEEKDLPILNRARAVLFDLRSKRVRPGLDNKILLGWNAMMNIAYSKASIALGDKQFEEVAVRNIDLLGNVFIKDGETFHTAVFDDKIGATSSAKIVAVLDDLAIYAEALIYLFECTGNPTFLERSKGIIDQVISSFSDEEEVFFYYSSSSQKDVIVRKKEIYDGATPSGNAVMARVLLRMSIYLDKPEWKQRSLKMLDALHEMAKKYPTSFGLWADLMQELAVGTNEIVVLGEDAQQSVREVLSSFIPYRAIWGSDIENQEVALLKGKVLRPNETRFYLCRDYTCQSPVFSVKSLNEMIKKVGKAVKAS